VFHIMRVCLIVVLQSQISTAVMEPAHSMEPRLANGICATHRSPVTMISMISVRPPEWGRLWTCTVCWVLELELGNQRLEEGLAQRVAAEEGPLVFDRGCDIAQAAQEPQEPPKEVMS